MDIPVINSEQAERHLTWQMCCDALAAGHKLPKVHLGDQFLPTETGTLMARAASISGLGSGVKTFTVTPANRNRDLPSVQGVMIVFDETTGTPKAIIDCDLVTKWKTAADSVLGAKLLANKSPKHLLILGAGTVAAHLVEAYNALFPSLEQITLWNRTSDKARQMVKNLENTPVPITIADDLPQSCAQADIISSATMATEPILEGEWVKPGTHVDLIGAFKADMREADDALLQKSRIFVDSFETTLDHIGELKIPLASGAISRAHVLGDFYDLVAGKSSRQSDNDITLFKNGGGAHLDLMIAGAIMKAISESVSAVN